MGKWLNTRAVAIKTMSINIIISIVFTLFIGLAAALTALPGFTVSTVFANHEFAANLTGQQEVPPVDTQATGEASFVPVTPNNETIDFFVNATGIEAVTQGHIHGAPEGENGPIVATLFKYDSVQNDVLENGTIAANNLEGPLQGKTISDLIATMKNGSAYVNVHTEQNPNGEIRGQLVDIQ